MLLPPAQHRVILSANASRHPPIVTNATGALNPSYAIGDICLMLDHLSVPSLAGNNALCGPNMELFGPRFPSLMDAYPVHLRQLAVDAADAISLPRAILHESIYAYVCGPSYESPSEAQALRNLGGDIVGMSTVPEVIVGVHSGMQVLGISLVTNKVVMRSAKRVLPVDDGSVQHLADGNEECVPPSHAEVMANSQKRSDDLSALVSKIVELLP